MARQVYFDPFGSYTEGYDRGVGREMQVQQQTRAARDSDFNYNYMVPIEYNTAKRDDKLGEETYGARRDLVNNTAYTSNKAIADEFGLQSGIVDPAINMGMERFNIRSEVDPDAAQPDLEMIDTIHRAQIERDKLLKTIPDLKEGATIEENMMHDAAIARMDSMLAERYGLSQYGLSPDVLGRPLPVPTAAPQYNYYMGDTRVGSQVNPREQYRRTLQRPEMIGEAERMYKFRQDAASNAMAERNAAIAEGWQRIKQGGADDTPEY